MRVIFWGTPAFALPSLLAVERAGHKVIGVVTRPDRPKGRGKKRRTKEGRKENGQEGATRRTEGRTPTPQKTKESKTRGRKTAPSPVRELADEIGLPVFTPESPKSEEFVAKLAELKPCVSVVVAYGRFLPLEVLELPRLGTINLHPSLLPELRGPAPVPWAIVRGYGQTGVSVMRLVKEMDAGPVLAQRATMIGASETATELGECLSEMGAELVLEVMTALDRGTATEVEQEHADATYAPMVSRETARINWSKAAHEVANLIRGMDDVPGAWTTLERTPVKLFRPAVREGKAQVGQDDGAVPGQVVTADKRGLTVATGGTGRVTIGEVQPAGKRRIDASAWVRGRGARVGDSFV